MTALQDLLAWTAAGVGLTGLGALAMGLAWRACAPGRGRTADGGAGRFARRAATLSALAVVMAATAATLG